jgi:hypothetical protein
MKFEFNAYSTPQTKAACAALVTIEASVNICRMKSQEDGELFKMKFWEETEVVLMKEGLISIDPYYHNFSLTIDDGERVVYQDEREFLCRMSDYPELLAIFEKAELYKKKKEEEVNGELHRLHDESRTHWRVIEEHLAERGFISKKANGEYPTLEMAGRIITKEESFNGFGSILG